MPVSKEFEENLTNRLVARINSIVRVKEVEKVLAVDESKIPSGVHSAAYLVQKFKEDVSRATRQERKREGHEEQTGSNDNPANTRIAKARMLREEAEAMLLEAPDRRTLVEAIVKYRQAYDAVTKKPKAGKKGHKTASEVQQEDIVNRLLQIAATYGEMYPEARHKLVKFFAPKHPRVLVECINTCFKACGAATEPAERKRIKNMLLEIRAVDPLGPRRIDQMFILQEREEERKKGGEEESEKKVGLLFVPLTRDREPVMPPVSPDVTAAALAKPAIRVLKRPVLGPFTASFTTITTEIHHWPGK